MAEGVGGTTAPAWLSVCLSRLAVCMHAWGDMLLAVAVSSMCTAAGLSLLLAFVALLCSTTASVPTDHPTCCGSLCRCLHSSTFPPCIPRLPPASCLLHTRLLLSNRLGPRASFPLCPHPPPPSLLSHHHPCRPPHRPPLLLHLRNHLRMCVVRIEVGSGLGQ